MKSSDTLLDRNYFFVDEAGDPTFYDKNGNIIVGSEGCSKVLLLGFIRTTEPEILRKEILHLKEEIVKDPFYKGVPSVTKTALAFHAKDDIPEIRERFYRKIVTLDFKAEFIVARKQARMFRNKYQAKENLFYDNLIVKLFQNKLHLAKRNVIYFATRGNKLRQTPLEEAIRKAVATFETKWNVKVANSEHHVFPQTPVGEPCLQIADYMNWAVYRAFTRGEDRYYRFVESKVSFLCDIFDTASYPKNYYNQKNPFDPKKISPL